MPLIQNLLELASLLSPVDVGWRGAENGDASGLKAVSQPKRSLAPELDHHANKFARLRFSMDHLQHILQSKGFEVEPVGGVVIG